MSDKFFFPLYHFQLLLFFLIVQLDEALSKMREMEMEEKRHVEVRLHACTIERDHCACITDAGTEVYLVISLY
jgi:hypothetical protein